MSTTIAKTAQRAALAAIAFVAVGSAVEAQAASVRGVETYVPADRAATAPGTLAATRAGNVRVVKAPGDLHNSTAITAPVSAESRKAGN
jgi:hypothetical protein